MNQKKWKWRRELDKILEEIASTDILRKIIIVSRLQSASHGVSLQTGLLEGGLNCFGDDLATGFI